MAEQIGNVEFQWNGPEVERAVKAAIPAALEAACVVFVERTRQNLSRIGTPTSPSAAASLSLGRRLLRAIGTSPVQRALGKMKSKRYLRAITTAEKVEEANNGIRLQGQNDLVDPPGGMPRLRTGTLRRSIDYAVDKANESARVGSGMSWAHVHEFGGRTPGGQPYIKIFGQIRFLRRGSATVLQGGVKYTKGSVIPARPFLRPSVNQVKGQAAEAFAQSMRQSLGGSA